MSSQDPRSDKDFEKLKNQVAELERRIEEDRMIFDQLPIMFWYKDTHNLHLRVNRPAAALEGLPITAIEGKTAEQLYPKEQAERFHREDLEVIGTNQPKLGFVDRHVSPIGKELWLKTGKLPTHDAQGNPNGVIAFALDMTEEYTLHTALKQGLMDLADKVESGANKSTILPLVKAMLAKLEPKA